MKMPFLLVPAALHYTTKAQNGKKVAFIIGLKLQYFSFIWNNHRCVHLKSHQYTCGQEQSDFRKPRFEHNNSCDFCNSDNELFTETIVQFFIQFFLFFKSLYLSLCCMSVFVEENKLALTRSMRSLRFFSICWGGRRLIRSRAQSSCCSVCSKHR